MTNIRLRIINLIVGTFTVNVRKHPEYLTPLREDGTGVYCDRNYKVGKVLEALAELEKETL